MQAREEVRLTHFYYSEWPGGVEEGEQVLLMIMSIPTRTSRDVGVLRHIIVAFVCFMLRRFCALPELP